MSAQHEKFNSEFLTALKIRKTEETLLNLYSQGHIKGTIHTSVGQEIIPVILYKYLHAGDWIFSNHRGHAHYLARTKDFYGLIAEILGCEDGCAKGIGGSQHLFNNEYMSNGIQGGLSPIAVGVGKSLKLKESNNIVLCHIGDGTLGQGLLYEALNISSLWKIPILFVLEDNGIAQSTLTSQTISGKIEDRFRAFNIKYFHCNSDDWESLNTNSINAIKSARTYNPSVIHIKTRRLLSHSKGDDNRAPEFIQENNQKDPINIALSTLKDSNKLIASIDKELSKLVNQASNTSKRQKINLWKPIYRQSHSTSPLEQTSLNVLQQIHQALENQLNTSNSAIFIGEDIRYTSDETPGPYGGAFKVTGNLSEKFSSRVINTPISEACITGIGTGLSIAGNPCSVEIMFGDFTTLIVDQLLQHSTKFTEMYGIDLNVPVVIRTPMGGRRGYGPTHSQSLEYLFLGIPNLFVISPNHRVNNLRIYKNAFNLNKPCLIAEHKLVYSLSPSKELPTGYEGHTTNEEFPTVILNSPNNQAYATVLAYGYNLQIAEMAAQDLSKYGIWLEIISPSKLSPFECDVLTKSVLKTQRFISIEEGTSAHGLGSSTLAYLTTQGVKIKNSLLLGNDSIIPASALAEEEVLPSSKLLVQKIIAFQQEEE